MNTVGLRRDLLSWYGRAKRDLPWRKNSTPYRVWVSEIMLQQTTVAAVTPKYEAFLRRFPSLASLASSEEHEVLKHWAGLGYYSRARNLRRAAISVKDVYGGIFPSEFDAVLALPGIGRYTTGAILSIAFGKPFPLVDGNVIRVFSRLFGLKGRAKDPGFVAKIWPIAERLVPAQNPGDWNQALMELGATICTPDAPSCGSCPVTRHCVALKKNIQDKLPLPEIRHAPIPVRWTCLWIEKDGKVLLWRRSANERLLKNLWGLPEAGRVEAAHGRLLAKASHSITHHALTVRLTAASLKNSSPLPPEAKWVAHGKLRDYLVSSLWLKMLRTTDKLVSWAHEHSNPVGRAPALRVVGVRRGLSADDQPVRRREPVGLL